MAVRYVLPISLLELKLKSFTSAHTSAIKSETAPHKYQYWLPIHAVTALVCLMDDGFVSVIVPTYNRAYCLCRTIDSVREQTYRNWEIVLVDDGDRRYCGVGRVQIQ